VVYFIHSIFLGALYTHLNKKVEGILSFMEGLRPLFDDDDDSKLDDGVTHPGINKMLADLSIQHDELLPKRKRCKESLTPGLKIIPYKTDKNKIKQRPLMQTNVIPRHASSVIFNGASGSGKTMLLVNLLTRPQFYGALPGKKKGYFDVVFLFSPTAGGADDLSSYLDIPANRVCTDFDTDKLERILKTQKEYIDKNGLLKSPKILIIFEDIQSDAAFMRTRCFKKCFIQSRHLNISSWLLGQSFNLTPRFARLQANNLFLFPCSLSEQKVLLCEHDKKGICRTDRTRHRRSV
jgi:hypothetical protein